MAPTAVPNGASTGASDDPDPSRSPGVGWTAALPSALVHCVVVIGEGRGRLFGDNRCLPGGHPALGAPAMSLRQARRQSQFGSGAGAWRRRPSGPLAAYATAPSGGAKPVVKSPGGRGLTPTPRPLGFHRYSRCQAMASAARGVPTVLSVAVCARNTLGAPDSGLDTAVASVFSVARAVAPPPTQAARATRHAPHPLQMLDRGWL